MHRMAEEPFKVRSEKGIPVGQKVRVIAGPFKGIEGVVMLATNQSRLVIVIESIMHAVSIEISPNYLENVKKQPIL